MTPVDDELLARVRDRLTARGAEPTPAHVAEALRAEGQIAGDAAVLGAVDALRLATVGAGPLEALLRLPGVTDVVVNGSEDVRIDRGAGLEQTDVTFADDADVRRLAQRLAATAGRRLDDAAPFVDVRLRDGTRFHAALAPVASPGTCLSLRVPARESFTVSELVASGTLTSVGGALLRDLVRVHAAMLISGGTGSGKTTLLSAMLGEVDPRERLVIVEDSSELRPRHPHVVRLEARLPNVEGVGEITLRQLVRQALRMRPDRLIVGEVRGGEVVDLLAAMNTGHEGGIATIHANSASDVPTRAESLGVAAGLPRAAVHAQFGSAIEVVLHLRRSIDGCRRLAEVGMVARTSSGLVQVEPAVSFDAKGTVVAGPAADGLDRLLARGAAA